MKEGNKKTFIYHISKPVFIKRKLLHPPSCQSDSFTAGQWDLDWEKLDWSKRTKHFEFTRHSSITKIPVTTNCH